jgi:hypothetical protein
MVGWGQGGPEFLKGRKFKNSGKYSEETSENYFSRAPL